MSIAISTDPLTPTVCMTTTLSQQLLFVAPGTPTFRATLRVHGALHWLSVFCGRYEADDITGQLREHVPAERRAELDAAEAAAQAAALAEATEEAARQRAARMNGNAGEAAASAHSQLQVDATADATQVALADNHSKVWCMRVTEDQHRAAPETVSEMCSVLVSVIMPSSACARRSSWASQKANGVAPRCRSRLVYSNKPSRKR